jgi:hypothetical protein
MVNKKATRHDHILNILAFPSQTTLLFGIIIATIIAALGAINLPSSPMRAAPPLAIFLAIFTLRDFLSQVDREIETHQLQKMEPARYPHINSAVEQLAQTISIRAPTILVTAKTPSVLFAFGSFRRIYIAIGVQVARTLEHDLQTRAHRDTAQAALLHEIQHFKLGDVVATGLARSLLKTATRFTLWSIVFFLGLAAISFSFPAADLVTPEFAQRLREANPLLAEFATSLFTPELTERVKNAPTWSLSSLYIVNAHISVAMSSAFLFVLIWRRLLQVRELYADAAVAQTQQHGLNLPRALLRYGSLASLQQARPSPLALVGASLQRVWQNSFHPSLQIRRENLIAPATIFSNPTWLGITAGILVTLIDFLLAGSFTVAYASETPAAFTVLISFVVLAHGLSFHLVEGTQKEWARKMLIGIGWVLFIRMGFHFLNVLLLWGGVLIAPQATETMFRDWICVIAGDLTCDLIFQVDLLGIAINATLYAIYLTLLIAFTLPAMLILDQYLKRIALTWYSNKRLALAWWMITLAVALLAGGIWLPVIDSLAPIAITFGFSITKTIILVLSLIVLLIGTAIWLYINYRWRGLCNHCRQPVSDDFHLGKHCPSCGKLLHESIHANY